MISPVVVKPFALNVLRVGISLLLFWSLWLFGKTSARIERKDAGRFILCGITGIAINQMFFIKGLTMTSTIHASLLILATPLLITVFAFWILKEKLTLQKGIGLFLGIGGAVLLILNKEQSKNAIDYLRGDLFILINAISYAMYFILVKPLMQRYTPLHVIRWVFTFGFFFILPFGWNELQGIQPYSFTLQHWIALCSVVITGTFLAYYFTAYGIQHLGAGITGSYIYTQPIFAVAIATIFFDEVLSIEKIAAGCAIFTGVFLVSFRRN